MSKQSEAKAAQKYTKASACCKTCKHFSSDISEMPGAYGVGVWIKENNKRCNIGGFAVQSSAHCDLFARKVEQGQP